MLDYCGWQFTETKKFAQLCEVVLSIISPFLIDQ